MKNRSLKLLLAGAIALLPFAAPLDKAQAAATAQVAHAYLCAPDPAVGSPGPRRVVNTSSTASPQPAYQLNNNGCALMAAADIGFFLSQGFFTGPALFSAATAAIAGGSSGTSSQTTNFTLPAYGYVVAIVLCETAGNAVTGGLNVGDAGSATRFSSATALGANACVTIADSALTRFVAPSGVPATSTILLAAVTSWNSASVNFTILYSFY